MKHAEVHRANRPHTASACRFGSGCGALCLGLVLIAGPAWAQEPTWSVKELGSLGGASRGTAINEAGQIVGGSRFSWGQDVAFIASPPTYRMTAISPPGSTYAWATGINDHGVAVGYTFPTADSMRVFITGPGGADPHELPLLPGSAVPGSMVGAPVINNAGQVAGTVTQPDGRFRFYITGPDGLGVSDLGESSYYDYIAGITSDGQVLQARHGDTSTSCFLTGANGQGGRTVGVPAGMSCYPADVEDGGRVLAQLSGPAGWGPSFVTGVNGSGITYLPDGLFAEDMNRAGVVIGHAVARDSRGVQRHAFVTGPGGVGMTDLNSVVHLGDDDWLAFGYAVNDRGEMVVESNLGRVFAVSQVPEPRASALIALGLLFALGAARRTPTRPRPLGRNGRPS